MISCTDQESTISPKSLSSTPPPSRRGVPSLISLAYARTSKPQRRIRREGEWRRVEWEGEWPSGGVGGGLEESRGGRLSVEKTGGRDQ